MKSSCPYKNISCLSWRLNAIRGLIGARSAENIDFQITRSFSSSSAQHKNSYNPNRRGRRRPGTKETREAELAIFRDLHANVLKIKENWNGDPESSLTLDHPEADTPQEITNTSQHRPSQLLKSSFLESRIGTRERRRKPQPTEDDKNRLKHNPWARLLASPVRMCSATGARIPRDILLEYGLVQHPTTKGLWLTPTELLRDELRKCSEKTSSRRQFPNFRITSGLRLLEAVSQTKRKVLMNKLIPYLWKASFGGQLTRADEQNAVWRKDMATYVLRNIRDEVVKALTKKNPDTEYDAWLILDVQNIGIDELEQALHKIKDLENVHCGAVLILKTVDEETEMPTQRESSFKHSQAAPYFKPVNKLDDFVSDLATLDFVRLSGDGTKVPVFNLANLLSKENLERIRGHDELFRKPAIFFRPGKDFAPDPILWLWKLKCFHSI